MIDVITLINTAKLEEIVAKYINIVDSSKKDDLRCICPFHPNDKNPSFSINPNKQVYHCFGCKAGGNVLTFIESIEKVDKFTAVSILKRHLGIVEEESTFDLLNSINEVLIEELNKHYEKLIKLDERLEIYNYKEFKLGYFPPDLKLEKLFPDSIDKLIELGLIYKKFEHTQHEKTINFFTNRLVFPIMNTNGVIGFSGRTLINSKNKYKNSQESSFFQKRRILFGLPQSKEYIVEADSAVLVEGNWDLIGCHNIDIKNVVSPLGTALTIEQLILLKRFTKNLYIMFDGDAPGKKASMKASILGECLGFNTWVADMRSGADPDSLILDEGPDAILNLDFKPFEDIYKTFDKEEVLKITQSIESPELINPLLLSYFKISPETYKKQNLGLQSKNLISTSLITHLVLLLDAHPLLVENMDDLYLQYIIEEKNKPQIIQAMFSGNPYKSVKNPRDILNKLLEQIK